MAIKNIKKFCAEIGISRQTFYKYKKEGMPLDNEEGACDWIAVNYGSGGGKNLKTSIEKKAAEIDQDNPPGIAVREGDVDRPDTLGVLARAVENERAAWKLLKTAKEKGVECRIACELIDCLAGELATDEEDRIKTAARRVVSSARRETIIARASAATRHYNICSESRLKAEAALVSMQAEERALEEKAAQLVEQMIDKTLKPLRSMLNTMPARMAAQCNQEDPDKAREVLEKEVERLFEGTYSGKEIVD